MISHHHSIPFHEVVYSLDLYHLWHNLRSLVVCGLIPLRSGQQTHGMQDSELVATSHSNFKNDCCYFWTGLIFQWSDYCMWLALQLLGCPGGGNVMVARERTTTHQDIPSQAIFGAKGQTVYCCCIVLEAKSSLNWSQLYGLTCASGCLLQIQNSSDVLKFGPY